MCETGIAKAANVSIEYRVIHPNYVMVKVELNYTNLKDNKIS
jgi:hypothetical protein